MARRQAPGSWLPSPRGGAASRWPLSLSRALSLSLSLSLLSAAKPSVVSLLSRSEFYFHLFDLRSASFGAPVRTRVRIVSFSSFCPERMQPCQLIDHTNYFSTIDVWYAIAPARAVMTSAQHSTVGPALSTYCPGVDTAVRSSLSLLWYWMYAFMIKPMPTTIPIQPMIRFAEPSMSLSRKYADPNLKQRKEETKMSTTN